MEKSEKDLIFSLFYVKLLLDLFIKNKRGENSKVNLRRKNMNQVQENTRISNVREIVKMFFKALSVNDSYIADPEEEVKKAGNEELIKSMDRIKKLEDMYKDTELSKNKIRENLKNINKDERVKSPKIKDATIHTVENKTIEKKNDDKELEL